MWYLPVVKYKCITPYSHSSMRLNISSLMNFCFGHSFNQLINFSHCFHFHSIFASSILALKWFPGLTNNVFCLFVFSFFFSPVRIKYYIYKTLDAEFGILMWNDIKWKWFMHNKLEISMECIQIVDFINWFWSVWNVKCEKWHCEHTISINKISNQMDQIEYT